jgi:hypothetical protein
MKKVGENILSKKERINEVMNESINEYKTERRKLNILRKERMVTSD